MATVTEKGFTTGEPWGQGIWRETKLTELPSPGTALSRCPLENSAAQSAPSPHPARGSPFVAAHGPRGDFLRSRDSCTTAARRARVRPHDGVRVRGEAGTNYVTVKGVDATGSTVTVTLNRTTATGRMTNLILSTTDESVQGEDHGTRRRREPTSSSSRRRGKISPAASPMPREEEAPRRARTARRTPRPSMRERRARRAAGVQVRPARV